MKIAINPVTNEALEVEDSTIVNTVGGIHYLLTEEEEAARQAAQAQWAAEAGERQKDKLRRQRTPLLVEADYKVNYCVDNGLNPNDWCDYRQALRDITNQPDPFNIVWPTKPE